MIMKCIIPNGSRSSKQLQTPWSTCFSELTSENFPAASYQQKASGLSKYGSLAHPFLQTQEYWYHGGGVGVYQRTAPTPTSLGVLSVVLGSPLLLVPMTPFSELTFKHLRWQCPLLDKWCFQNLPWPAHPPPVTHSEAPALASLQIWANWYGVMAEYVLDSQHVRNAVVNKKSLGTKRVSMMSVLPWWLHDCWRPSLY